MRNYLEVDLNALEYNLNQIKKLINLKQVIAVIKADAYGHGSKEVFKKLVKLGVKHFGVATLNEALEVNRINNKVKIHIFGLIEKKEYKKIEDKNIIVTVQDFETLDYLLENKLKNKIHIKIDTGMTRLGFNSEDLLRLKKEKKYFNNLKIEGIFSHLSSAENNKEYTDKQLKKFDNLTKDLKIKKHILNSAGLDKYYKTKYVYDYARIGISLYGGEDIKHDVYKPVMKFYSQVYALKKVKKNTPVSYNNTYISKDEEIIAIIPTGYADGLNRKLSNRGYAYIEGKKYPIIGNICMDMCMVKVDENVKLNSVVEFFGNNISVTSISEIEDTIVYEIMCGISKRVKKKYIGR